MRYAVLDLGSNTFHLLIVESIHDAGFKEIYRERQYVKLAEKGIKKIGKEAYQRALHTLAKFKSCLDKYQVEKLRVFGTATIRSSENGRAFIKEVKEKYNLNIESISGAEEAKLIARGVMEATQLSPESHLIMDIGGGSVEFIIVRNNKPVWSQSYDIGISLLKRAFHTIDPITKEDKKALRLYLNKELGTLKSALKEYGPVISLVGASGSFEVLIKVLGLDRQAPAYYATQESHFKNFKAKIENLNYQERISHPHIPDPRADLIVVAIILIDEILNLTEVEDMIISEYALKEGALSIMRQSE